MDFNDKLYEKLKHDIAKEHGIRNTNIEKANFRKYIMKFTEERDLKYNDTLYSNKKHINIIIGDLRIAKFIICAHYDTAKTLGMCGILPCYKKNINNYNDNSSGIILSLMLAELPKVAVILFDHEEFLFSKGLKLFSMKYIPNNNLQLFINFDCVGDGKYILCDTNLISTQIQKLIKNEIIADEELIVHGFFIVPTDTKQLKKYNVIGFSRSDISHGFIPKLKRIHTSKDTILNKHDIKKIYEKVMNIYKLLINNL